ncbi:MAG: hypothetical protein K6E28_03635 [Eubacterium sp.]|nr:hypothetical protein [Eubacterium sp.]
MGDEIKMNFKEYIKRNEYDFIRDNSRLGNHIILLGVSGSYGYGTKYQTIKKQRKLAAEANPVVSLEQYKLSPNSMQVDFINNLKRIREQGEDKALLISATG